MTYRELLSKLKELDENQLDCTVTVLYGNDDYFPAQFEICEPGNGILDDDHPILVIR